MGNSEAVRGSGERVRENGFGFRVSGLFSRFYSGLQCTRGAQAAGNAQTFISQTRNPKPQTAQPLFTNQRELTTITIDVRTKAVVTFQKIRMEDQAGVTRCCRVAGSAKRAFHR